MKKTEIETKIREYSEHETVKIVQGVKGIGQKVITDRLVILALNEGGCNGTQVDLLDVIDWVKENRPDLLK